MRWLTLLRNLPGLALLALLVALTLRAQTFWQTGSFFSLCLSAVWLVAMVGWGLQQRGLWRRKERLGTGALILPACFAFVVACWITHLPLRVMFWTQREALERALKRAPIERQLSGLQPQARIGSFRPLQISKSGIETCFILWENEEFLSGTAVGFAHCPDDDGCSSASFDRFYFDSESEPRVVQMSRDWVAFAVHGSDM